LIAGAAPLAIGNSTPHLRPTGKDGVLDFHAICGLSRIAMRLR